MFPGTVQGDLDWYRQKAIASGGRVLELGAGTGRITIPIAEAGIEIHALDLSENMLAALRHKTEQLAPEARSRVSAHHGDMRSFELPERFALAIVPFRAFLHNTTRDDQLAALACIHRHLRDGGELAFNVFHPSLTFMAANAGERAGVWRWDNTRKTEEGFVVYCGASRYDTVRQRVESMIRTEEFASDGTLRRTHMIHLELAYLYPSDIAGLLDEAGFDLMRISGDFTGRAFERDQDELVIEARKR